MGCYRLSVCFLSQRSGCLNHSCSMFHLSEKIQTDLYKPLCFYQEIRYRLPSVWPNYAYKSFCLGKLKHLINLFSKSMQLFYMYSRLVNGLLHTIVLVLATTGTCWTRSDCWVIKRWHWNAAGWAWRSQQLRESARHVPCHCKEQTNDHDEEIKILAGWLQSFLRYFINKM